MRKCSEVLGESGIRSSAKLDAAQEANSCEVSTRRISAQMAIEPSYVDRSRPLSGECGGAMITWPGQSEQMIPIDSML